MKKQFLPNVLGGVLVCVVSTLGMQQAQAQAQFDGGNVLSTASGPGSNMQFMLSPRNGVGGPYVHMYGNDNGDVNQSGSINFISGYNSNQSAIAQGFLNRTASGSWARTMQILQSGQVLIGDNTRKPSAHPDYRLAVDGKIVGTSLFVTNPNNWADFVFEPSYQLMSLPELERYLKLNKHLPAVPSAQEVLENGYSVTDMDAKLLRAVEELTLRVIELNKKVAELEGKQPQATK